jgi:hypothetical protein
MQEATPEEKLAKIKRIVDNTDEHRNRARRESWEAVKNVLLGIEPEEIEEEPEAPDDTSTADSGDGGLVPPPKVGAGSGAKAWREYAVAAGFAVPDDASRAEVIEALEANGVAIEAAPDDDSGD